MNDPRTLARGDIVTRGGNEAVVWSTGPRNVTLAPIVGAEELRRRGDIEITEADVVGPLASRHGLIRGGSLVTAPGADQIKVGRVLEQTISRLANAIAQAADTARIERSPPIQSHLTRTDHVGIHGRRVGAKGPS